MSDSKEASRACLLLPALGLVLTVIGIWSVPAQASFGNCNDPRYLTRFDSRLAARGGVHCSVVATPITLATTSGTARIRIVKLAGDGYPSEPQTIGAVRDALGAIARATTGLDPFAMDDTSILVGDTDTPGALSEHFGTYAATADWTDTHGHDGECDITLWRVGTDGSPDEAGPVIAHELFHCIEAATLSRSQMATYGAPGSGQPNAKWWAEGAADWFSTLALPAPEYMHQFVDAFDTESPDTPLYHMNDGAVVFFDWLGQTHGPRAVIPFLHHMAASSSAAAQRAAMTGALHPGQWLQFAKDYLDGTILDGQGMPIHSEPKEGGEWEWEESGTRQAALPPFVLKRAHVKLESCDDWKLSVDPLPLPAAESIRSDRTDNGDTSWHSGPLAARGKNHYVFAGMNTKSKVLRLSVSAEKLTDHCEVEHEGPEHEGPEHEEPEYPEYEEPEYEEPVHGSQKGHATGANNESKQGSGQRRAASHSRTHHRAPDLDPCLVGEWRSNSASELSMLKTAAHADRHKPHCGPGARCSTHTRVSGRSFLIMNTDGSYVRREVYRFSQQSKNEQNDGEGWGRTDVNQLKNKTSGRWSVKDGTLTLRPTAGRSRIGGVESRTWERYRNQDDQLVTKKKPGHLLGQSGGNGSGAFNTFSYTCTDGVLKLIPPMRSMTVNEVSFRFPPILYQKTGSAPEH